MFEKYLNKISRNYKLSLFCIVAFGLLLRLIFFYGVSTSDDLAYSKYAYNINKGIDLDSTLTLSTRLGIIYPTSLSYSLFGVNDFSSVLFVLLTSIGNIVLAFYFGKLLFNEKIGIMAAFLMSIFPLEVVNGTKLLTDIPSAFFMALGVYAFLYAEKKSKPIVFYFICGILIGIGYLIRESALLIALFFMVYILYKRQIKKEYFFVPLGVIVIFCAELLILYRLTGNPFFKFTVVQDFLIQAYEYVDYFGRLSFPEGLFHYPYVILTNNLISFFYILIFISIIYFVLKKKRETYILFLWFIPILLYLSFGSASLTKYLPFKADPRYLSIITIPGILLVATFLSEKKETIKRVIMPLALVLLLLTSIWSAYANKEANLLDSLREAYPYLVQLDSTAYIDKRSMQALNYISGYKNTININEYPGDLSNIKDDYIIINKGMIRNLKESDKRRKFPYEIENPPQNWKVIKEIGKEEKDKIVVHSVQ